MLKKIVVVSILLGFSFTVNAGQCPPGSALRHDISNKNWILESVYAAQGWGVNLSITKTY
jgi:hypothetical protein